jgi:hypothetical protein
MQIEFNQLGSQWSAWPPLVESGLNLVDGVRVISSEIISLLLTIKGENPVLWEFGLSPQLFDPLSTYDAEYWVYEAQREILRWVGGIKSLSVQIENFPDPYNRLSAFITFVPTSSNDQNLLVFPWYSYTSLRTSTAREEFLDEIQLNGQRWSGFPIN